MTKLTKGDFSINVGVSNKVGIGACVGALSVDEKRDTNNDVDDYIRDKQTELGYGEWFLTDEDLMQDIHMNLEDGSDWDEQRFTPLMKMYVMPMNYTQSILFEFGIT